MSTFITINYEKVLAILYIANIQTGHKRSWWQEIIPSAFYWLINSVYRESHVQCFAAIVWKMTDGTNLLFSFSPRFWELKKIRGGMSRQLITWWSKRAETWFPRVHHLALKSFQWNKGKNPEPLPRGKDLSINNNSPEWHWVIFCVDRKGFPGPDQSDGTRWLQIWNDTSLFSRIPGCQRKDLRLCKYTFFACF